MNSSCCSAADGKGSSLRWNKPFFGFGFWAKIQTLPREFTTPLSFRFARNVREYKKALAGDGD